MTTSAERTDRLLTVALRTLVYASIFCISGVAYGGWIWYAAAQRFKREPSDAGDALSDGFDTTVRYMIATLVCGVLITILALERNARRSATRPKAPWR